MGTTAAAELHQLKNSLAVIAGWARTLDDRWDDLPDDRRREGVAIIRRTTEVVTDQTRLLLEVARAEPA